MAVEVGVDEAVAESVAVKVDVMALVEDGVNVDVVEDVGVREGVAV